MHPKRRGKRSTAIRDVLRQLIWADLDAETLPPGVAVVIRRRADLAGKHVISDHVHAVIRARDVLLELGGTPPHPLKPRLMPLLEPGDNAADSAQRFIDDGAVFCPELPDRVGIRRHQSGRHVEADGLNEKRLIRLGAVARHCRRAVHDVCRRQIGPRHQGVVDAHRVLPGCAELTRALDGRKLSRAIRTHVGSGDLIQPNHLTGCPHESLNRTVDAELDLGSQNVPLVDERYFCLPPA
jgi:hypothetical protein